MANLMTETREVGEFDRILMKGVGKLIIKQGSKQELTIEAEENLMKRIRTNVINGKLMIDVGSTWEEKLSAGLDFLSKRRIIFNIMIKKLTALEVSGACKIEAKEIKADGFNLRLTGASSAEFHDFVASRLNTSIPGAGKVVLSGEVQEQQINLTGAGSFDGAELKSQKAKVNLTGVGSAKVWVTDELDVTITGMGSVNYYGEPRIKQSIALMGSIKSLGKK